jgi:hypothetical protein
MQSKKLPNHPILLLLADSLGNYVNTHQTEICLHSDDSISISCEYPSHPVAECKLFKHFSTISDFLQLFPGDTLDGLDGISPEKCYQLFEHGDLSAHCIADPFYGDALLFTRDLEGMNAVDEDTGLRHRVIPPLLATDDYLQYTRQYFTNADEDRDQVPSGLPLPPQAAA